MPCDIKNHICKAKRALELSKIDQENLRLKVEEWKKSSPSSSHFFRPYVQAEDQSKVGDALHPPDSPTSKPGHFTGDWTYWW